MSTTPTRYKPTRPRSAAGNAWQSSLRDALTAQQESPRGSLIAEMGLTSELVGDELISAAPVTPEMCFLGTGILRASIVAAWTDTMVGFLSINAVQPRVPVTVDL